jgi:hypothetical protein
MICKNCNKAIISKNKKLFCNRSCSATYNNKISPKRKKTKGNVAYCLECNKEFYYYNNSKYGKYCSNQCSGAHRHKIYTIPRIERGECKDSVTLRKYLASIKGYKCTLCYISEWQNNTISLHVDHIDGNADNNCPSNLRLLCPNCHSQTDTFCGRNKTNTKRSEYNKRYRIRKLKL